jgi:hypothetical protein
MKRLIAALALAILAVPAFADNNERSTHVEQQSGYFDPSN